MRSEKDPRVDESRVRIGNHFSNRHSEVTVAIVILLVLVLPTGRLFSQVSDAAGPLPSMSSDAVQETARKGDLYFLPRGAETANIGFIFYPGAKVPKEHSLGGVAASIYAKKHGQIVAGMIFLASYPSKGGALNDTGIKVLSMRASNDKLATKEKVDAARKLLPESARYVSIEGGNHAQFGNYGPQRNYGAASISAGDQQKAVLDSILAFLASVQ